MTSLTFPFRVLAVAGLVAALLLAVLAVNTAAMASAQAADIDYSDTKVRVKTKNINPGDTLTVRWKNLPDRAGLLGVLLCPTDNGARGFDTTTTDCATVHEVRPDGRTTVTSSFVIDGTVQNTEFNPLTDCTATAGACFLWFLASNSNGAFDVRKNLTFEGAAPRIRVKTRGISPGDTLRVTAKGLPTNGESQLLGILLCPTDNGRPGFETTTTDCAIAHEHEIPEGATRIRTSFTIAGTTAGSGGDEVDCTAERRSCFLWFLMSNGELDVQKRLVFADA